MLLPGRRGLANTWPDGDVRGSSRMLAPPVADSRFAVVRAPSGLGLRAPGVEGLVTLCSGTAWRRRSAHASP